MSEFLREAIESAKCWRRDRDNSPGGWSTSISVSACVKLLDELEKTQNDLQKSNTQILTLKMAQKSEIPSEVYKNERDAALAYGQMLRGAVVQLIEFYRQAYKRAPPHVETDKDFNLAEQCAAKALATMPRGAFKDLRASITSEIIGKMEKIANDFINKQFRADLWDR